MSAGTRDAARATTRLALLAALAGCAPTIETTSHELGNGHAATPSHPLATRARTTMRLHGEDLQQIDDLLRAGDLRAAATHAYLLSRPHPSIVMARWPAAAAQLRDASWALIGAQTLPQAVHAEARIASACGACHALAGATPGFERDVQPPADDGTPASRWRRHRWAAERIADGIVGASDRQWRAGLAVYANDLAGYRVQRIATRALASHEDRDLAHAELRDACLTCHPSVTHGQRRFVLDPDRAVPAP